MMVNPYLVQSIDHVLNQHPDPTATLQAMGCSIPQWQAITHNDAPLGAAQVFGFCRHYGLSMEWLAQENVTGSELWKRIMTPPPLPEIYAPPQQAYAKVRTMVTVLPYIDALLGSEYSDCLLGQLGLHRNLFLHPNHKVHPQLITDFNHLVIKHGLHENHFRDAGRGARVMLPKQPFAPELSAITNPVDIYPLVFESILPRYYDNLFNYRLVSHSAEQATITVRPENQSHSLFNCHHIGSRADCLYKQGHLTAFAALHFPFHPEIHEHECLYMGDPQCRYTILLRSSPPSHSTVS